MNSLPDEMMTPDGNAAFKGKINVSNMLNTHFAKVGEKTSEEASQNLAPNSANFKTFLSPFYSLILIPHRSFIC